MSYTLYDAAILHTKEALNSLSSILKKAESHANSASFPTAKLAPDMLDLSFQVYFTTDTAQKIVARTTGTEPLTLSRDECTTFPQFHARIAQVLEVVEKADREILKSADMKVRDYVQGYGIPNVFFHLTTAYAILRKEGVELGKQDYIGAFMNQYF
ncbi:hypothetical protein FOC1_g10002757 [Fusarium oxysporum f. sp. cubense race 1]|uniref:DUF1993 domain-containing protein n=1 Tax=Fusarium oxysporum f. sp. cubense (strain race 1) TaxID=1229664 RepID=N4UAZ0_FUSC1|nr:hypothetical protein FOC1_g10002757 [Fusarium oxysporum f. sp. cubense race 1]